MRILRRKFLKTMSAVAATAFTFPAILSGQMTTSAIQRKELDMEIKRVGTQASTKGPGDWFTGTVRIDPLFQANAPARAAGASVTFEPGARTRLERDARTGGACWSVCLKQRINTHRAGEPIARTFRGRLCANSFDFHI